MRQKHFFQKKEDHGKRNCFHFILWLVSQKYANWTNKTSLFWNILPHGAIILYRATSNIVAYNLQMKCPIQIPQMWSKSTRICLIRLVCVYLSYVEVNDFTYSNNLKLIWRHVIYFSYSSYYLLIDRNFLSSLFIKVIYLIQNW